MQALCIGKKRIVKEKETEIEIETEGHIQGNTEIRDSERRKMSEIEERMGEMSGHS